MKTKTKVARKSRNSSEAVARTYIGCLGKGGREKMEIFNLKSTFFTKTLAYVRKK